MNGNDTQDGTEQTKIALQNTSPAGILSDDGPTNGNIVFSPGAYSVSKDRQNVPGWTVGGKATDGFTRLAEAGTPGALVSEMESKESVTDAGTFGDGPIGPSASGQFTVDASEQAFLSFAAMLVPSNDMVVATRRPIPLRFKGERVTDETFQKVGVDPSDLLVLLDAGTEPNAPHGEGENQAPVQSEPLQGEDEGGTIQPVSAVVDGVITPEIADIAGLSLK